MFALVFLMLASYLYLIQVVYDSLPKEKSWIHAAIWASLLLGGGLSWDVTKHVTALEVKFLMQFVKSLGWSGAFFVGYIFFGVLLQWNFDNITGELHGLQLIVCGLLAAFFCYKTIASLGQSLEAATAPLLPTPDKKQSK